MKKKNAAMLRLCNWYREAKKILHLLVFILIFDPEKFRCKRRTNIWRLFTPNRPNNSAGTKRKEKHRLYRWIIMERYLLAKSTIWICATDNKRKIRKKKMFFATKTKAKGSRFLAYFFFGLVFCWKINFYHGTRIKSSDSLISDTQLHIYLWNSRMGDFCSSWHSVAEAIRPFTKLPMYLTSSERKENEVCAMRLIRISRRHALFLVKRLEWHRFEKAFYYNKAKKEKNDRSDSLNLFFVNISSNKSSCCDQWRTWVLLSTLMRMTRLVRCEGKMQIIICSLRHPSAPKPEIYSHERFSCTVFFFCCVLSRCKLGTTRRNHLKWPTTVSTEIIVLFLFYAKLKVNPFQERMWPQKYTFVKPMETLCVAHINFVCSSIGIVFFVSFSVLRD